MRRVMCPTQAWAIWATNGCGGEYPPREHELIAHDVVALVRIKGFQNALLYEL